MNRPYYEPGLYLDIPNKAYHDAEGLSASHLKKYLSQTGEHIAWDRAHPTETPRDRIIGSACHSLLLQPERFDAEFLVHAPLNLQRSKDRDLLLEMRSYNPGRQLLVEGDYEIAKAMAARALAHKTAGAYLEEFIPETSVFENVFVGIELDRGREFMRVEQRQVLLKCRPDLLSVDMPVIPDIKTTMDASQSGFGRQIRKLNYHLGAFHYLKTCNRSQILLDTMGVERFEKFVFIAIENFAPYCVACYELSPILLEEGARFWELALNRIHAGAGDRGYPDEIRVIDLEHTFKREAV